MKKMTHNAKGFTLIELMIATTVFSMVLVVMLASFLQVSRMFYKGVSVSSTNEATRSLLEEMVNDVRFAQTTTPGNDAFSPTKKYFCIGNHRYTYVSAPNANGPAKVTAVSLTNPNAVTMTAGVVEDTVSGCPSPSAAGSDARQLLGPNMQLNDLDFVPSSANEVRIHVHVVLYGVDNTVFDSDSLPAGTPSASRPALALKAPDAHCSGSLVDTELCAASDFNTVVNLRE